jgi:ParB-like chromosome segregation protein Spo0J
MEALKREERWSVAKLEPDARNARTHSEAQIAQLAASLKEFGWTTRVLVQPDGKIIAGHGRILAAHSLGWDAAPVIIADGWSDEQIRRYMLLDNQIALNAGWDSALLKLELESLRSLGVDIGALAFSEDELAKILGVARPSGDAHPKLADRFLIAPFSVFNAREGWWQDRKRAWISIGIKSELGRDDAKEGIRLGTKNNSRSAAPGGSKRVARYENGERITGLVSDSDVSIFDPVLCEIAYRWFAPRAGMVLDPFAGGSVRGIVAAKLGLRYRGHELRSEQCAANEAQRAAILGSGDSGIEWIAGDSRKTLAPSKGKKPKAEADLIFTCPPYADLERYSDDPADLSTMKWEDFEDAYFEIIQLACAQLKADRFAVCVVGEVRGKNGAYYNFVSSSIEAFRRCGLDYYNEAILITAVGSLPIRAAEGFSKSRKLGKTHQNILVFCKGDPKKAAAACGEVDVEDALAAIEKPLTLDSPGD